MNQSEINEVLYDWAVRESQYFNNTPLFLLVQSRDRIVRYNKVVAHLHALDQPIGLGELKYVLL